MRLGEANYIDLLATVLFYESSFSFVSGISGVDKELISLSTPLIDVASRFDPTK